MAAIAAVAAAIFAMPAHSECAPAPGPLAADSPATAAYVARYNALVARDPYLTKPDMAPGWRSLLADLKADRAAPPDLTARTGMMLAASLQGDDGIAEALAAAKSARDLALANGLSDTPLYAEILTTLANKEVNAGHAQEALTDAEAALAGAARQFGARSWAMGRASVAAASAYYAFGRFGEAEHFSAQAEDLALACLAPGDPRIVNRIASHAATLGMSGRLEEALAEDERAAARALARLPDSDAVIPFVLDNYGWELRNAGRLRESEAVLRHALDLTVRYHKDDDYRRGSLLGKLANVLDVEGHHREAEALWLQASDYERRTDDLSNPLIGSGELRRAADAAQARGDIALALSRREAAIALMVSHAPPKHPELARARIEYASTLLLAGRSAEARITADSAIALLRAGLAETDFKRMGAEIAYARVVAATDPEAAYRIAVPVTRRLETMLLDTATSRGDLIRLAPGFSASFATLVQLALSTNRPAEAFRALQLANLSDIVLVNADVALRAAAANPVARAQADQLTGGVRDRQLLDRERVRAIATHDSARLATLDVQIRANDQRIQTAEHELDRVFPAFRAIARPQPVALDVFRAHLGRDDILLAPVNTAGGALTIAVTREGLTWAPGTASPAESTDLVARIRVSIDAGRAAAGHRFDAAAARALYSAIVPSALKLLLRQHHHLLYYASGALATVPPALLVAAPLQKGRLTAWLIRTHSITILPALSTRPARAGEAPDTFLGIGAPTLRARTTSKAADRGGPDLSTLPALPDAAREVRMMAAMYPPRDRRLLLGDAATRSAVAALPLRRFGVIAIATHGLLSDALPGLTEPALVLTPGRDGSGDDGLLRASDIANWRLDADWVILSACDTASGSDPQNASYSGLTSAFVEAGARSLLVSHWPVRDDAAQHITVATLRESRRGVDRATALRHAMLALMADRTVPGAANPAVWAPFVLVDR